MPKTGQAQQRFTVYKTGVNIDIKFHQFKSVLVVSIFCLQKMRKY